MKKRIAKLVVVLATAATFAAMPSAASAYGGWAYYYWNPCPIGMVLYGNAYGEFWCQ